MTTDQIETILASATGPDAAFGLLHAAVRQEVLAGENREVLLRVLERARAAVSASPRPDHEDVILEVMDCLCGFCATNLRI